MTTEIVVPHWQKEIPTVPGTYWLADRLGCIAGPYPIVDVPRVGFRVLAPGLGDSETWEGWFWSEPIPKPVRPPSWD